VEQKDADFFAALSEGYKAVIGWFVDPHSDIPVQADRGDAKEILAFADGDAGPVENRP
jgi:hypothetical protein